MRIILFILCTLFLNMGYSDSCIKKDDVITSIGQLKEKLICIDERNSNEKTKKLELSISELKKQVEDLKKEMVTNSKLQKNGRSSFIVNDEYSKYTENKYVNVIATKLSIGKLMTPVVRLKYINKTDKKIYIGLNGCVWRNSTSLVDKQGNIFQANKVTGMQFIECASYPKDNDPVELLANGSTSITFTFTKPNGIDEVSDEYSFVSDQLIGTFTSTDKWKRISRLNIQIPNLKPNT